jgi:diguanylate cyclase (GGDEF)-like protein
MKRWFSLFQALYVRSGQTSLSRIGWRLLPGVLAALLVTGLLYLGIWQPLEDLAYTGLFQVRGSIPWSDRIAVIEIDEASLDQLGRFPWSRQNYADLLNVLTPAEPSAIALDILFPEPSADDTTLAQAMKRLGRVVIAQSWDDVGQPLLPTPALQAAAIGTGHVYKAEDPDGLVRSIEPQKQGILALGVAALQVHSLVYEPVFFSLSDRLWINWPGQADQVNHYSFVDVLEGRVTAQTFHNQIILVGVTAAALDPLQTPFNRNPPIGGVYLQAAVVNSLLQHNALQRLGDTWQPLVFLVIGPLLALVMGRWRLGRRLMAWAGFCITWGLLSLLLLKYGYWVPVATPLVLMTLTTASVTLAEQYRMSRMLQQSEERYSLAVQGSNEGLWDWNLTTNVIYVSPRWLGMLGVTELDPLLRDQRSLLPHPYQSQATTVQADPQSIWFDRVHPDDQERLKQAIAAHIQDETPYLEQEYRMRHEDGSYHWMLSRGLAVRNKSGNACRMAGSQNDITQRKETEEKLRQNAFFDALTGLPNRTLLLEQLRDALTFIHKYPSVAFAVLWLDLDHFRVVNNSLGSDIGDRLLVSVAQRLRGFLSPEDTLARNTGDEFIILLNQIHDVNDAIRLADRVQQLLALPFHLDDHEVYTSVSIGIALSSLLYNEPEHLLRDADTAMHRAKALGRSRYQVFDSAMRKRLVQRMQLQNDLRRAIAATSPTAMEGDRQALMLYYQPIIRLSTRQIIGFEALVRWQHPDLGMISPAKFVGMAEETGLIIQLGWWVLREACRQMREWQAHFPDLHPLVMNVNLSSKQFSASGLTEQIRQTLQETQLEPGFLKLEITESTVMENASAVVGMLHQIRNLGIQIAIDDFGTGYSSLSYLPRFPINTLKIDRSFVSKMGTDHDGPEIVRTILTLAHNLSMDVTAEGIETADQAAQLLAMGCEYGQGYFFSKPLPKDAATAFLEQDNSIKNNFTP